MRNFFAFISAVVSFLLITLGAYHGLWEQDYARGCFEFLLALLMRD